MKVIFTDLNSEMPHIKYVKMFFKGISTKAMHPTATFL